MKNRFPTNQKFDRLFASILSIVVILTMAFPATSVASASSNSPFLGKWEATDLDGSSIRLVIAGPANGPFQITWTDSHMSFCDGKAGIVRGTGVINESDPNLLEADLHVECFTTGATEDAQLTLRYHPTMNTLSARYGNGKLVIWHRPGSGQTTEPPPLGLRVNYGDDWVESFYEGGHTAWITVTDSDGNVKATSELMTEPKDYWEGETGFQSLDSIWFADGNPMENPPDIQPNDWVFGWVDNGAAAQVQIGDIRGTIDLAADSITGTISAAWFTDPVQVECLDWGSGGEPLENKDGGSIEANGNHNFSCSWEGEWDIQPGQTVGVGYSGPDGNWVANTFSIPRPTFVAYMPVTVVGYDWPMEDTIDLYINDEHIAGAEVGNADWDPTVVLFELWRDNILLDAGDHIVMTDENAGLSKEVWVTNLSVTDFDLNASRVFGTYDPAYDLWVWLYDREGQVPVMDPDNGTWTATFTELPPGVWGGATQWDADGDGTSIDFQVPITILVASTEDLIANDGVCTLREAVIAANTNSSSGDVNGECPAGLDSQTDTIILAAEQTYSLARDNICDDDQVCGDLDIWDNSAATDLIIMVEGNGAATISQDAVVDDRVLENPGAAVHIDGLTLTGGNAPWSSGGINNGGAMEVSRCTITGNNAPAGGGGGISNWGSMTLINSTVSNNTSTDNDGGGIANSGQLTIDDSILSSNATTNGGGGGLANFAEGTVTIRNGSQVYDNSAGTGGGLFNYGTLTVADSKVHDNTADYGGGLSNWAGILTLSNSAVTGNISANDGGGIHNTGSATINIENGSVISGNSSQWNGGGLANWNDGTVTISNATVSNNTAGGGGGGLSNHNQGMLRVESSSISGNSSPGGGGIVNWGAALEVVNSTISDNTSAWGGGITTEGGTLTLDASTVSGNKADNDAGGIFVRTFEFNDAEGNTVQESAVVNIQNASLITGNTAAWGGGISSWGSTLIVDASVISNNSVTNSGGGLLVHEGGTAAIQNGSIITGNTAQWEGGISNWGGSTLMVDSSTISNNTASDASGGIGNLGSMTVNDSIISDNAAPWGGGIFNNEGTLTITSSTISGNVANNGSGGGILNIKGRLVVTDSALLGNTATGQGGAVYNYVDTAYTITVTNSCVVGNSDTAFFNEENFLLTATSNWWGDASGPGGVGTGSGDSVGINITFDPWLPEPPAICTP